MRLDNPNFNPLYSSLIELPNTTIEALQLLDVVNSNEEGNLVSAGCKTIFITVVSADQGFSKDYVFTAHDELSTVCEEVSDGSLGLPQGTTNYQLASFIDIHVKY
jgi:hypothetical protein